MPRCIDSVDWVTSEGAARAGSGAIDTGYAPAIERPATIRPDAVTVVLGPQPLTAAEVEAVARHDAPVALSDEARATMAVSRAVVERPGVPP